MIDLAQLPFMPKRRYAPHRQDQTQDMIPEEFSTAAEAGIFWDTHSAADYVDDLREVKIEFDIQSGQFMVPVDSQTYIQVKDRAALEHRTISDMITILLQRELRI